MNDPIVAIKNHLKTEHTADPFFARYFVRQFPGTIDEGILVLDDNLDFDLDIDGYVRGHYQVVVRSTEQQEALEKALLLTPTLKFRNKTVGGIYFQLSNPLHYPMVYPRTDGDYFEASVNFDVAFSNT